MLEKIIKEIINDQSKSPEAKVYEIGMLMKDTREVALELYRALGWLVELKNIKELHGEVTEYTSQKPMAWKQAKALIDQYKIASSYWRQNQ